MARPIFPLLVVVLSSWVLIACQSSTARVADDEPVTDAPTNYRYIDSTQYFAAETASVSMRATFSSAATPEMVQGYQFQFRTLDSNPSFLVSTSIIAGGQRFFLEQGELLLTRQAGLTLNLSLEDALAVAAHSQATLQFRLNDQSYLFSIGLHQLKPFLPQ